MLSSDEAAEATQDVFVRAWQKIGSYRGEAAFGTWLHRLAVNVLPRAAPGAEARPRAARRGRQRCSTRCPGGHAAATWRWTSRPRIARLPPGARQVFVLHDVEGYRHEEIADFLGVTTGTTKAQLHRARMLLRGHLNAE